jgi:D-amino peptidase
MKIYMMTDLEGVAGVSDFEDRASDTQDNFQTRMRMRRLLTGEVNAAIDGLFAAGATEVIVNDGHGAGYTIDFEQLDPRAQIIHGHERPVWLPLLDETCAATILIGAHAKASSPPGLAYHTMSKSVKDWSINGVSFGEMGLQALIAGYFGVPMVFVSGDAHACREIRDLIPGVVTAAVKRGLSRRSAVSWAPQQARAMIRAGVQQALQQRERIRPLRFDPPLLFRDERYDETWTKPAAHPDIRHIDHNTREITASDIPDLLQKLYGYPRDYRAPSLADEERASR